MKRFAHLPFKLSFILVVVCVGAFALLSVSVRAQTPGNERADKAMAQLQKRFTAADTNRDGQLSREEARTGMPRLHVQFDHIDKEKTGSVSLAQIAVFVSQQMGR